MKKVYLFINLLVISVSLVSLSAKQAERKDDPTVGWTKTNFEFDIHRPYNLAVGDRYTYGQDKIHRFLIRKGDQPFKADSKTSPRCEMRIKNNYTTGMHQFEADVMAIKGSHHPVIMQVFGTERPAFMLKVYDENGGSFKQFDSKVLDTGVYGKWKHINVVHDANSHEIRVYIDKVLRGTFMDKGAMGHYFKCGLYTTQSEESAVQMKNINYWTKD